MCKDVGPSYFLIEVLHIQDAMKIIQEQRELGFDIPLCIKVVIKVKKCWIINMSKKGLTKMKDLVKMYNFLVLCF
jgi:uncharacterized protein (DUF302 family)